MGQIDDQGEWERCRSSRRMFLALVDSGKADHLGEVARGLLRMAHKRMPGNGNVLDAQEYWDNGLRDDKDKELADRTYLVIRFVTDALDRLPNKAWDGGGDVLVCTVVRKLIPLAPPGFSKVGKMQGKPSAPSDSSRVEPYRSVFRSSR